MLIEDVACEVDKLADMSVDLIDMFERHGYGDASVFGHAMEGNMHLVFSQGFRNASDIDQFSRMMQVSFLILRPFGPRRATATPRAGDVRDRRRQVQGFLEGRARHGSQRVSLRRDGVGRQGLRVDVAFESIV